MHFTILGILIKKISFLINILKTLINIFQEIYFVSSILDIRLIYLKLFVKKSIYFNKYK